MAKRRKQQDEQGLGLDSFVDIVANTLGILVLLVIITMVTTEQKLIELTEEAIEHREWLSKNKDLYAELEDEMKTLSPEELARIEEWRQMRKQLGDISAELVAARQASGENEDRVRMVENEDLAAKAAESELRNVQRTSNDAAKRLEERQGELDALAQKVDLVKVKVPAILLAELERTPADSVIQTVEVEATTAARNVEALEASLKKMADRIAALSSTDAKKELERLRALKEQIDRENSALLAQLEKLRREHDDLRERSEQLAFGVPRRESRVKKANRLFFECASTGVLFLYETNGRRLRINETDYATPSDRAFPLSVRRLGGGEDAVAIWKGSVGETDASAFERRLAALNADDCDVVFIVRSHPDAYRHFRRARYVAEEKLGFVSQVNLLTDGDTLTLRSPSQSRRLQGDAVAGGSRPDDSADALNAWDDLIIVAADNARLLVAAE